MAVMRRRGAYDVTCDECGGDACYEEGTFKEAVARFKDDGGRVYFSDWDEEWRHVCKDCRDL